MQRLSGWVPTAIRGEHSPSDLVLSLAVRELEEDSFIFALCQDHKMRMWSMRVRRLLWARASGRVTLSSGDFRAVTCEKAAVVERVPVLS